MCFSSWCRKLLSSSRRQEHLYGTMFTSGQVLVERYGAETDALVEGLRLQWSYGFPFTPKVIIASQALALYSEALIDSAYSVFYPLTVVPYQKLLFLGGGARKDEGEHTHLARSQYFLEASNVVLDDQDHVTRL